MKKPRCRSLAVTLAGVAFGSPAFAQTPHAPQMGEGVSSWSLPPSTERSRRIDNIGNSGQLVFGVDRVSGVAREHVTQAFTDLAGRSLVKYESSLTDVGILGSGAGSAALIPRLAMDYLVMDGASLGIAAMVAHISGSTEMMVDPAVTQTGEGAQATGRAPARWFALAQPRMGYAHPFNHTLGVWSRSGLTWIHTWSQQTQAAETGAVETVRASVDYFSLMLDAMLVVSPMEHFAVLLGPFGEIALGGSSKYEVNGSPAEAESRLTSFGLSSSVVGYFP